MKRGASIFQEPKNWIHKLFEVDAASLSSTNVQSDYLASTFNTLKHAHNHGYTFIEFPDKLVYNFAYLSVMAFSLSSLQKQTWLPKFSFLQEADWHVTSSLIGQEPTSGTFVKFDGPNILRNFTKFIHTKFLFFVEILKINILT